MGLTEYLKPSLIRHPLKATDKNGAITELVGCIAEQGLTESRGALLEAVLEREAQRTTGIGRGFAVPHAKCDAVDKLTLALGRAEQPIDFQAVDGKPVELIALLASPTDATRAHIQVLAQLSRLVSTADVYARILSAPTAEELYRVIAEADSNE